MGLADLGDDLLRGCGVDLRDGKLEEVAFGDGGVEAGAGVEVHQLADDGQAQVGEEDFGAMMALRRWMGRTVEVMMSP